MTDRMLAEPPGGWPSPWPLLFEVARGSRADMWVLVGGLMVQDHAMLAGVTPTRATTDVDIMLDLLARDASTSTVVTDLEALGFVPKEPGWPDAPFHRFTRGSDVIDLLVPDHLPSWIRARVMRRPVMAVDGGAQALERAMAVSLVNGDGGRECDKGTVRLCHTPGGTVTNVPSPCHTHGVAEFSTEPGFTGKGRMRR